MPPSRKKKSRKHSFSAFYWAYNNKDQIGHLTFFSHLIHWSRRDVTTRFNDIVKSCISDESRKRDIQEKYKAW
jgi:hypothetical protein